MTSLSLDELVQKPASVKKLTARGECVQVMDGGKPLWVVSPAHEGSVGSSNETGPDEAWWNAYFEELEAEPVRGGKSAAQILSESRGE